MNSEQDLLNALRLGNGELGANKNGPEGMQSSGNGHSTRRYIRLETTNGLPR